MLTAVISFASLAVALASGFTVCRKMDDMAAQVEAPPSRDFEA